MDFYQKIGFFNRIELTTETLLDTSSSTIFVGIKLTESLTLLKLAINTGMSKWTAVSEVW